MDVDSERKMHMMALSIPCNTYTRSSPSRIPRPDGLTPTTKVSKHVAGQPTWKNRATKTKMEFYQNAKSGKIRIVAREQITNKLRLNQLVANQGVLNIDRKSDKQISWSGFDVTIEAEDEDRHALEQPLLELLHEDVITL